MTMIDLDEARRLALADINVLGREQVALASALGRTLADPIESRWALPIHDNSAMDGYGIQAGDASSASEASPVQIERVGVAAPGHPFAGSVGPGQAVRIFTGAKIPAGVDAIIPQENVVATTQWVQLCASVDLGAHIRRRGEDIDAGSLLLPAGTKVDPDGVMALASFGHDPVWVHCRPQVAIVTCGDELVSVSEASGAEVVDIAGPTLAACCRGLGADAQRFGPAIDELEGLARTISEARASKPDLLVTIGGASVGDRDLVAPVLDSMGMQWAFSRVRVKPGKPTGFGFIGETPVFVLPGNPGAAKVVFGQLVAPVLAQMQGRTPLRERRSATVAVPLRRDRARATVLQVRTSERSGRLQVDAREANSSARLTPTLRASGSMLLPPGPEPMPAGTVVEVELRRAPALRPPPPLMAFIGSSGSGKTTVVAALVQILSKDMRVGVIKHGRHFDVDRPGKDSDRFRVAGARAVIMGSPDLTATLESPGGHTLDQLLLRLPGDLDLILVEGFKYEGLPSIEVHRDTRPVLCCEPGFEHVFALVTNEPSRAPTGMPCYDHDDLSAIEALVRRTIEEQRASTIRA